MRRWGDYHVQLGTGWLILIGIAVLGMLVGLAVR